MLRWIKDEARRGKWNVSVRNVTDEYGCLSIAGPNSQQILAKLSPVFQEKFPFLTSKDVRAYWCSFSFFKELSETIFTNGILYNR